MIRAKSGKYLAVPLNAAKGSYLGNKITPAEWERIFGAKLRPLFRPGKTPLLVADGNADRGGFTRVSRDRGKKGKVHAVPVFALLSDVPHANRVALEPAIGRAREYLSVSLSRRLGEIGEIR